MSFTKTTQLPVEVVFVPNDANVRVSQVEIDVSTLPTDANVRISQIEIEALSLPTDANVRVSQIFIELIRTRFGSSVVPTGTLELTGFAPSVINGVTAPTGGLILTGFPPTASVLAGCQKFKLYAISAIEFIGFGEDQLQSFNIVQVDEEMKVAIDEPRVGRWSLPTGGGEQ